MVAAALIVEFGFAALGLIPERGAATLAEASIREAMVIRFVRTGGPAMLKKMG